MASLGRSRGSMLPLNDPTVSVGRLRVFALTIAVLLALLLTRLWVLQVLRGETFHKKALSNRSSRVRRTAPRGAIEDSKGRVLVTNSAQFTVFVSPSELPKDEEKRNDVFRRLAGILKMTPEDLETIRRRNRGGASDPIAVAENVDKYVLARIAENRLNLPGVEADVEPVRRYPEGKLAAHLLGYIGQISESEIADKQNRERGYRLGDFIGKFGVEKQYDRYLNGVAGGAYFEIDARGRRQRELSVEEPVAGATLRLALNKEVQVACEKALAGRTGAVVALDPRDGRVLAMVSSPAFDPNVFARRPLARNVYRALIDPKTAPLQNRAVMSPQPPGSTFKIVTAAAGLATGAITPDTWDFCAGGIPMGRRIKRCHARHGSVNLDSALAASCDVFFYHAGFRIAPTPLADWAMHFGLGQKSGIDLPSEKAGTVPSPAWKKEMAPRFGNPDTGWYRGDTANMAIGQGDLQTTPLQMALVAAGIANNGVIYRPRVVQEAIDANKKVVYRMKPEVSHRLALSPETLRLVAQGMRRVVGGPRGTSRSANLTAVTVAGKSGSAEVRGGGPTHGWFVFYAPYDNPTIAGCVFLETDGKLRLRGGADAAPIARDILAAHFKVSNRIGGARRYVRGD